jgi:acyl-CoA thioesterase-2
MDTEVDQTATERPVNEGRSLLELLELERTGDRTFAAGYVFPDPYPLFGGQVAAQALRAAEQTLESGRFPHSLHGYFLRPGNAAIPTELEVEIERDGRAFSSRRVTAVQAGKAIFTMSASFHVDEDGPSEQCAEVPAVTRPSEAEEWRVPRLFSFEGRVAEQDFPHEEMRSRFWARCTADLGDDRFLHACAVTYFADITNAVAHFDTDTHRSSPSLDYSMWFHRPVRADRWMLLDLVPHVVAQGRGWYTGSVFQEDGMLVTSLAQESLFREGRPGSYFPKGT